MTKEPKRVDKWGQIVKATKERESTYGDAKELEILNTIKVFHILVDDQNTTLYVRETKQCLSCYCARNLAPRAIEIKKVLYTYLQELLTIKLKPIFFDKFGTLYKAME